MTGEVCQVNNPKVGFLKYQMKIGWVVPPPSKSHHQDYYIFSRGSL